MFPRNSSPERIIPLLFAHCSRHIWTTLKMSLLAEEVANVRILALSLPSILQPQQPPTYGEITTLQTQVPCAVSIPGSPQ